MTEPSMEFHEWRKEFNAKLTSAKLQPIHSWDKLYELWKAGTSVDAALQATPTPEALSGAEILQWAADQNTPDIRPDRLVPAPYSYVGTHNHPVFKNDSGTVRKQNGNIRSADFSGSTLEERLLDPACPIDIRIKHAWETVRIKRGNLGHAEFYASDSNFEDEMSRVGRQIEFLLEYRSRLRYVHTYSSDIQSTLADELYEAERQHRALTREREAIRAAKEAAKLAGKGKKNGEAVQPSKKVKVPKTAEEILAAMGLSNPTPEQLELAKLMASAKVA
jgi:hypothetical protein